MEPAIGAVALDSTFADVNPLILRQWKAETHLPVFLMPGVFLMNRLLYGYDLRSVRPVEEIIRIPPRPILILHCNEDSMVPVSHAHQLAEAAGTRELHLMDACQHAELYRDHPKEYIRLVVPFFVRALK
jgi:fermentation-respiration switch protein FrsA (DUF1100 family)